MDMLPLDAVSMDLRTSISCNLSSLERRKLSLYTPRRLACPDDPTTQRQIFFSYEVGSSVFSQPQRTHYVSEVGVGAVV